ncbi:MAG: DNA-directed RNA polymerase subunit alpha C-terminal domain-containing protein [Candidatus Moranbacteria bacterium]|nr:DNA-directed RNA polymerase subunit alpha C-terminal domain-containing protein [Candidatus Moranbacteria bacterium]
MKLEIKITEATIQELAQLDLLFGESLCIENADARNKTFSAMLSSNGILGNELFKLVEMPHDDLLQLLDQKNFTKQKHLQEILHRPLEMYRTKFSIRTKNCLHNNKIYLIGELVTKTEKEMLKTQNFGRKCLNELKYFLEELDLSFGMILENFPDPKIIQQQED